MISLKYGNEYRLDVETLPDGTKKDVKVYIGPLYESNESVPEHKKNRIFLLISEILFTVLLIASLSFYTDLGKVWYVIIPTAFNVLLAYMFFEGVFYFWPVREQMNREQKEKGQDRLKQVSLSQTALSFFSTLAAILTCGFTIVSVSFNDIVFCILVGLMAICAVSQSLYLRRIYAKDIENALAKKFEKI